MLGFIFKGLPEGAHPSLQGLPFKAVEKIDPDIGESGFSEFFNTVFRLRNTMASSQKGQFTIVEGLNTQIDAVEAQGSKHLHFFVRHIQWIGFDGHFGIL